MPHKLNHMCLSMSQGDKRALLSIMLPVGVFIAPTWSSPWPLNTFSSMRSRSGGRGFSCTFRTWAYCRGFRVGLR
ncbi:hypothetical protein BC939DRAFT_452365 [Gamsiella multidivaricata]|uniref:uncharacterized protein n=1 Tax=Gamsiella multidivaricata TaxID=101098 RepID=UPI00221F3610|nr:uncharacterized protein BC939DRAFT_452365 [Gamsiella multidivaricata]KAI7822964.1 hypothetical protein BC939DRAFT_452365 [Gamsiella multidivaricata]